MNQVKRSFEPIKPLNRSNKNFIYKGKKYPINFCLLQQYSNFFYNQRKNFKNAQDIEIQTINFEITEEAIPMFVACCQNQSFDITDSIVFSLYHLSKQYEVPELTKLSDEYIQQNYKNLVLQSILYIIKSRSSEVKFDLSKEENVISSHFFEYIDNDQLISLPVQVLYRILNNSNMTYDSLTPENQKRVVDFLFACLDKHSREASVLFSNFDFGAARTDVLSRLIYDYSSVFDFGMINSHFLLKTTSQLLSEVEKLKIEHSNKLSQMEKMVVEQTEVARKCEKQLEEAKKEAVEAVAKSCRMVEEHLQKFESVLNSQKVEHKKETDELNQRISAMEKKIDEQSQIIEKQTKRHVVGIKINSKSNFLILGKETKLTASLMTSDEFNEGVEWKVLQGEEESAVEVCEYNERELVLKGISPGKKVKVVAVSRDGSKVEAMKEFTVTGMSGKVNVSVQADEAIKGTINLVEHGVKLDKQRSRYLLSSSVDDVLGADGYSSGIPIGSLSQAVLFMRSKGVYYLHALVVDSNGDSFEIVSRKLETNGVKFEFDGNASHRFSGIINYLRGSKNVNVSDEGIISVSASSVRDIHYAKNAVDFEKDDFYHSDGGRDWLLYDFKDKKICPTHYSIRTPSNHANRQFPMNWCIEVSNTGNENDWKIIDSRQNVTSVSSPNQSDTFNIGQKLANEESYRYVRFRSTGDSSGDCGCIVISSLEYFGALIK